MTRKKHLCILVLVLCKHHKFILLFHYIKGSIFSVWKIDYKRPTLVDNRFIPLLI